MKWLQWTLLALCALPALATAQGSYVNVEQRLTPEQLKATGLDTLSPSQLALLNQLLRDDADAVASPPAAAQRPATAVSPAASTDAAPKAAVADRQSAPAKAPMFIGLNDEPIKSRIVGTVSGWQPGSEFTLANGQRWKVLKGELTLRSPLSDPPITVLPGVAGRWFLQVDENLPSARVYRIE